MKSMLISVLLLLTAATAGAQDDTLARRLMTRRLYPCPELQLNCTALIPELHAAGKSDSLEQVLAYWERSCGPNAYILAYRILNGIRERRFSETLYGAGNIALTLHRFVPGVDCFYFDGSFQARLLNLPGDSSYRRFIASLATSIPATPDLSPAERFLTAFFADPNEARLRQLGDTTYKGTVLQEHFMKVRGHFRIRPERYADLGITAGAWLPGGRLSALGTHPYVGIECGSVGKRWEYCAGFLAAFRHLGRPIGVYTSDSLFQTQEFTTLSCSLTAGYAIIAKRAQRLELVGGPGISFLNLLNQERGDGKENYKHQVISYEAIAGISYRIRIGKSGYFGGQAKYHLTDFSNPRGTDLKGNFITVGLVASLFQPE